MILPVTLLLLLRRRLHHPERGRTGRGGQREVRADATRRAKRCRKLENDRERTVAEDSPVGDIPGVASAEAFAGASAGIPGADSPAGGSPGGHPVSLRRHLDRPWLPGFFHLLSRQYSRFACGPLLGSVRGFSRLCVFVRCIRMYRCRRSENEAPFAKGTRVAGQRLRSSVCRSRGKDPA